MEDKAELNQKVKSSINLTYFPSVLQEGFQKYGLSFPPETETSYEPKKVFRMVAREKDDYSSVSRKDFMSYAEKYKKPRRGHEDDVKKPVYYGASSFTSKETLVNKMKLPRPGKKITEGYLKESYGPILTEGDHVCLWVYSNAEFIKQ